MKYATLLGLSLLLAGRAALAQGTGTTITPLLSKDVVGIPGKELEMITVVYQPGASDPVHRHNAHAMVYVLEGTVTMQVEGKAPETLKAGDTFYESPGDIHTVARNASRTRPAKFVVFFMKDKGVSSFVPIK